MSSGLSTAGPHAGRRPADPSAVLATVVPTLLSAVLCLPFLGRTPLFRDEAATLSAAGRPLDDLFELLGSIDLVHGLYYLVMHAWLLVSTDTAWIRLPGAIATVGAVAVTSALALRLAGPLAAVVSGCLVAGNTLVIHQALVARSYPTVLLLTAALALVTFTQLQRPTPRRTAAATVLGVLAALTHVFAGGLPAAGLLGAAVLVAAKRRWRLGPFVIPFVATSASMAILAAAASRSRGTQLAWLDRPPLTAPLHSLYYAEGGRLATWLLLVLAAAGALRHRRQAFVWVLSAWGIAAPVFLVLYSLLVAPVYVTTYIIVSVVPLAVLAAVGLDGARLTVAGRFRDAGPAVLGLLLAGLVLAEGAPFASAAVRDDDARTIAAFVTREARAGDVLVYTGDSARPLFQRYLGPSARGRPRDVLLVESPAASGTLDGRTAPPDDSRALAAAPRVWLLATLEDGDWPRARHAHRAALAAVSRSRSPALSLEAGTTRATLFARPAAVGDIGRRPAGAAL